VVTTTDLPTAASHPFYRRLNQLLREHGFDDFVEAQCRLLRRHDGPLRLAPDETGGLRRAHVHGHENVLKRLLVHASAFNLGLWMRRLFGVGTPRALQGRAVVLGALLSALWPRIDEAIVWIWARDASPTPARRTSTGLITWS